MLFEEALDSARWILTKWCFIELEKKAKKRNKVGDILEMKGYI